MVVYKCKKCDKTWQHPVRTCPFCLGELERVKCSMKAKVVAISKVSIPSLLHPKVPYNALVLENDQGIKYAYKTFAEVSIGDIIDYEPNGSDKAVSIWRINYESLDGIENIFQLSDVKISSKDVLIIPSLNNPNHAYFRENTSPEFLDATISFLKKSGITNITVAQQSFSDTPIGVLAQKSGLLEVCLKHGITPVDLSEKGFIKKGELEISKAFLEAGTVLNLGIMKAGKASTTENLFKIIKKDNYSALKYLYSEDYIAVGIKEYLSNVFNLGESYFVQREDKFTVYWGTVMGSRDSFSLDRVFNHATMTERIPGFIKGIDINTIPTVGRSIEEIRRDIKLGL